MGIRKRSLAVMDRGRLDLDMQIIGKCLDVDTTGATEDFLLFIDNERRYYDLCNEIASQSCGDYGFEGDKALTYVRALIAGLIYSTASLGNDWRKFMRFNISSEIGVVYYTLAIDYDAVVDHLRNRWAEISED